MVIANSEAKLKKKNLQMVIFFMWRMTQIIQSD